MSFESSFFLPYQMILFFPLVGTKESTIVNWVFSGGLVSFSGSDCADHLLGEPIEELMVEEEN
jgi:hypothetical protein